MNARAAVPLVDTNIIPDRNAGVGSLLWDLQNPRDPDPHGPPLLNPEFAFIDVGVSRPAVATALKALLACDLEMDVHYVATERLEAVPYANVTPEGDRAEKIRGSLSRLISSTQAAREVGDWQFVVDRDGKVSSVAYSYDLHGNVVWEAYFMGRPFMVSGEEVRFLDPSLEEVLAAPVREIEERIDLELKRDRDPGRPAPSWDGYTVERNPLEAGLSRCGITLQKTAVPERIEGRQNVLFLGNVLNHHPRPERARELDRLASNMDEGDLVIVQDDEVETSSIEVLLVEAHGARKSRERVRWIDTRKLDVQQPVLGTSSWRQIHLKPKVERTVLRLMECLATRVSSPAWHERGHQLLVYRCIGRVFATFFRAVPVEETLRVAIREALRRLPSEAGLHGIPVFEGDAKDAWGGALGSDPRPVVSEVDLIRLARGDPRSEGLSRPGSERPEVEAGR